MESFEFSDDSVDETTTPDNTPIQLYRSKTASYQTVLELLLEREDLTEQDVLDYCQGRPVRPLDENSPQSLLADQQAIYRRRRKQIAYLLKNLKTGDARVDADGRLVPVLDPMAPPAIALPPPPPAARDPPLWLDQDEEDREWIAQGEREAADALQRMRQRWRDEGVPAEDVELVRIPPDDNQANLTFRRVCYAVLAVVGCFTAIMLQTLPLSYPTSSDKDTYLGELLNLKTIERHLAMCPQLHRNENLTQWDHLAEYLGRPIDDCADGVVQIPSPRQLLEKVVAARSIDKPMTNLALSGINVSWFFDCHAIDGQPSVAETMVENASTSNDPPDTCTANEHGNQCFRGIHDDFLSSNEVNTALELGARLILDGGDHHDIYSAATKVPEKLQIIVDKIQTHLRDSYFIRDKVRPVAFRIGAEGPMDGTGIPSSRLGLTNSLPRPVKLLNLTNYVQYVGWENETALRNFHYPGLYVYSHFETNAIYSQTCKWMNVL